MDQGTGYTKPSYKTQLIYQVRKDERVRRCGESFCGHEFRNGECHEGLIRKFDHDCVVVDTAYVHDDNVHVYLKEACMMLMKLYRMGLYSIQTV